jgi:hypothetical protein
MGKRKDCFRRVLQIIGKMMVFCELMHEFNCQTEYGTRDNVCELVLNRQSLRLIAMIDSDAMVRAYRMAGSLIRLSFLAYDSPDQTHVPSREDSKQIIQDLAQQDQYH